jgi:signal transduction histidine kinase
MAQNLLGAETLAKIIDGASIPSFVINRQHEVTHWNTAVEALTGVKKEEIIGTDEQWRAFYTEERPVMADLIVDGASADEIETYYRGKCEKSRLIGGAYEGEDFFPNLGEGGKWLHFTASPIKGDNGEIIGAIETLEDVTERKRAEEMLAKIIDGTSIASFVINIQHRVTHWNTAIEALTGVKKEEIIGTDEEWRPFYTRKRPGMADLIVDGASADKIEAYYQDKCKRSRLIDGAYEGEDFFPNLGEGGKWLHFTASPIKGDSGEIIGAIETLEDVTERKRAEDNLRHHLQEITRAQEDERKRIARELHDDTAQVLGSLSRQLDNFVRKKHGFAPNEVFFLKDLQAQLNQGVRGVHRFVQDLRPSLLDDLGLIPALRSLVKGLQESDGLTTDLKVLGRERRFSPEVELLLFRVVQEAVNNIRKHAQASEAQLVIDFGEDRIKVTINDNGRGFELLERIDDFVRSGKLGLAGMQERVGLLDGNLKVKSTPGKGTTLTIVVPTQIESLESASSN